MKLHLKIMTAALLAVSAPAMAFDDDADIYATWDFVNSIWVYGDIYKAGEDNRNVARMATLLAGLPPAVPGPPSTGCALRASMRSAPPPAPSSAGEIELRSPAASKSMSRAPFVMAKAQKRSSARPRSTTPRSAGASSTR